MKKRDQRGVFISYRRADADALAGRIRDRMTTRLPDWTIFMDVASIGPGANFRQAIDSALDKSAVFVALIGRRWMDEGRSRGAEDFVRYEISAALTKKLKIVPVLINDARMPSADVLPEDIALLADLNAVELRHTRFEDDFANLAYAITGQRSLGTGRRISFFTAATSTMLGAVTAIVLVLLGLVLHFEMTGKSVSQRLGDTAADLVIPAAAVLGGFIGFMYAARKR